MKAEIPNHADLTTDSIQSRSHLAETEVRISPECITPEMLTLAVLDQGQIDNIVDSVPGRAKNVKEIYPLSPLQEGLLFHWLLDRESDSYVLSTLFELQSRAHVDALAVALEKVIARHDALRSAVLWEKLPKPVLVVHRDVTLSVDELELDRQREPLDQLLQLMKPIGRQIDLRRAPLMQLHIAADPNRDRWYAVLHVHHLICDHQSLRLLVAEVLACVDGKEEELPPAQPFRQFVSHALANVHTDDAEAFFRRKLAEVDEPTAPFGLLDVHTDSGQIEEASLALDSNLARDIRRQARAFGVSAARLFHAAWGLVVARTSGRDDVVFGTVLSVGRQIRDGSQHMLGLTVNTLPLRLRLRDLSTKGLVEHVQQELADLSAYNQASLAVAQRCSGIVGTAPLFTALLNYRHSAPKSATEVVSVAGVRVVARGEAWSNYPVALTVDDLGDGFVLTAGVHQRIGPHRTIGYLEQTLQSLVDTLERAPSKPALMLEVLPARERDQIVDGSNPAPSFYPAEKLIQELFEEQVRRAPNSVAVAYEAQSLTYAELNRKANQLAHYLRTRAIGPDSLVAICVDRSLEMFVGLLGILKAGGAYVPLDPTYPPERLRYMLEDAAPKVVLTQERTRATLPDTTSEVIALDGDDWTEIAEYSADDLDSKAPGVSAKQLAYLIYTSGSTGVPKGVMIEHRSVVNLWHGLEGIYGRPEACQRIALNASINFDASVQQLVQLLSGRTIFLVPQECRRDVSMLLTFLEQHHIEGIDCTPSQLRAWISAGLLKSDRTNLRVVLVGGEAIDPGLWAILARCSGLNFFNVYGPTECTVDATVGQLRHDTTGPHIGVPMANRRVFILNRYLQPTPIGVAGEIYIGGSGVGRGYLNQPELTKERFIADPFSRDPSDRMYKTGDIGRRQANGNIEYLGRNDQQVKIRGFRIELGEIEAHLVRHELVREAVVVAREDVPGDARLIAYIVPGDTSQPPVVEDLRMRLKAILPEHMMPSAFALLDRLPLTPSGKLDRRELPSPQIEVYRDQAYEPPRGEVEETMAEIWRVLLRVDRVGRRDNFFELGGHSLLIVQLMERLRSAGLSTEVRHIFENPILEELARTLVSEVHDEFEADLTQIPTPCDAITPSMLPLVKLGVEHIERIVQCVPGGATNIQDIYPLAAPQEGILFHHLLNEQAGDVYVLPTLLSVSSRQRLDDLIDALQRVIDRHDVLRTAVQWEQLPRAVQVVCRNAKLPVVEVMLDPNIDAIGQANQWMAPERQRIDIRSAPPVRLQVAQDVRSGDWYVLLQLHHITIDHVTLEILISEVVAHLNGAGQGLPAAVSYRNHVAQSLVHSRAADEEAFFRRKLGSVGEPTAPFGLKDVHGDGTKIDETTEALDSTLASRARTYAQRLGVSVATLFHAAWALVVAGTTGRDDVVFGSVLLGRLQGSPGAQHILGMMINTLPFRSQLDGVTASGLVEKTHKELAELLSHEQASLALAQHCSGIAGASPLFTTLLNYRHSRPNADAQWSSARGVRLLAIQERTNYPITVSVDDLSDGFSLTVQTDRRIDPRRVAGYLRTSLQSLVAALENAPDTRALALTILPAGERHQILELFNSTGAEYASEKCIHELFEEQVERSPNAVAVVYEEQSITYAELNRKANQLAEYLRFAGVGADDLVGLCVERSLEMVTGLLGILKAGGAYMPLDPSYPTERLEHMLLDGQPKVVLMQSAVRSALPMVASRIIELDEAVGDFAGYSGANLPPATLGVTSRNLLYVIYTSGSTGRPKGTAMPHRSMANLIDWHRRELPLREGGRVLQFAALSFDVAFQEIFSTLCAGGALVLVNEWVRKDARALLELLEMQSVERLFVPPLMLQSMAECVRDGVTVPRHLKEIITAGEQLRISQEIIGFFRHLDRCRLHNHYGPTETHVVTSLTLTGASDDWPSLPTIGQPIANTQIYILDSQQQPTPIGVAGEIYIGGANVALGYLNQPELTLQRFQRDPFSRDSESRMYRTGDLGQWHADGSIEYLGRNDDQVKIRGFRIELGEIEAQLARHPQVRDAAVVAREDTSGEKRLVAYVTQRAGGVPSVEELRLHLKCALPEHMVPSAFVILDSLPITPTGKLDRRALPPPAMEAYASQEYAPPQGWIEEGIARIWRELLQVDQVGRGDNFFELGGHSLLAVKALVRLNESVGSALTLPDMYTSPTLSELASRVGGRAFEDEFVDLSREAALSIDIVPMPNRPRVPAKAVMLTGGTGFVGRFLLAQLLLDTDADIYSGSSIFFPPCRVAIADHFSEVGSVAGGV